MRGEEVVELCERVELHPLRVARVELLQTVLLRRTPARSRKLRLDFNLTCVLPPPHKARAGVSVQPCLHLKRYPRRLRLLAQSREWHLAHLRDLLHGSLLLSQMSVWPSRRATHWRCLTRLLLPSRWRRSVVGGGVAASPRGCVWHESWCGTVLWRPCDVCSCARTSRPRDRDARVGGRRERCGLARVTSVRLRPLDRLWHKWC